VIEAGRTVLHEGPMEIADVVTNAMRMLSSQAESQDIRLTASVPIDMPILYGDLTAIERVLLNLLGNAIKFTPAGGSITLTATHDQSGITIGVRDTGIGIKADDLERVLQPFEQSSQRIVRSNQQGIGLGLPISKSLMELHGGTLTIGSQEGQGTTACIHFPACRVATA